ncbi:MAG: SoxR reducing system RseC family protein [candidate division WOR-3 bacterium]
MKDKGTVVELKDHMAKVMLSYNPEICVECSAKLFCGIKPRETEGFVWAKFKNAPEVGQVVEVEIPETRAVLLSTLMFIVPIIIYGLAFWVVHIFVRSVGLSALIALIPAILYYPALMRVSDFFVPKVVEREEFPRTE